MSLVNPRLGQRGSGEHGSWVRGWANTPRRAGCREVNLHATGPAGKATVTVLLEENGRRGARRRRAPTECTIRRSGMIGGSPRAPGKARSEPIASIRLRELVHLRPLMKAASPQGVMRASARDRRFADAFRCGSAGIRARLPGARGDPSSQAGRDNHVGRKYNGGPHDGNYSEDVSPLDGRRVRARGDLRRRQLRSLACSWRRTMRSTARDPSPMERLAIGGPLRRGGGRWRRAKRSSPTSCHGVRARWPVRGSAASGRARRRIRGAEPAHRGSHRVRDEG